MKITEGVRKYAAEQGIKKSEALAAGLKEKAKEFAEKGFRDVREALILLV
jgi:phosphomethylpyrimidine synthase